PLIRLELARLHFACARPRAALAQAERALACRGEGGFPNAPRLAAELAEQLGRLDDARRQPEALGRLAPDRPTRAPRPPARARRLSSRFGHNPKKGKTQAEARRRVD